MSKYDEDRSVYVGNLERRVPIADLEELIYELFLQAGPVEKVYFPSDSKTGWHKNYGFVEFEDVDSVSYSIQLLDGLCLYGRPLRVRTASKNDPLSSSNDLSNGLSCSVASSPMPSLNDKPMTLNEAQHHPMQQCPVTNTPPCGLLTLVPTSESQQLPLGQRLSPPVIPSLFASHHLSEQKDSATRYPVTHELFNPFLAPPQSLDSDCTAVESPYPASAYLQNRCSPLPEPLPLPEPAYPNNPHSSLPEPPYPELPYPGSNNPHSPLPEPGSNNLQPSLPEHSPRSDGGISPLFPDRHHQFHQNRIVHVDDKPSWVSQETKTHIRDYHLYQLGETLSRYKELFSSFGK